MDSSNLYTRYTCPKCGKRFLGSYTSSILSNAWEREYESHYETCQGYQPKIKKKEEKEIEDRENAKICRLGCLCILIGFLIIAGIIILFG